MESDSEVFALMIERSVEGEWYFDVDSLYTSEMKALLSAKEKGIQPNNFYVEPMVVK